jgi:MFS family permease
MLVSIAVLAATVRDNRSPAYRSLSKQGEEPQEAEPAAPRVRDIFIDIFKDRDRSRLLLLAAIFLFSCAWASSRSLVTPYIVEVLDLSRGAAGSLTLPSGVAFILAAYPAAMLCERFGRLRVMTAGMALFSAAMVLGTLVQTSTGTVVAVSIGAAGGACFLVNAVVVLWNLAPSAKVFAAYAGLYTVSWTGGGFLGPAIVGGMVDITGWPLMLVDIAAVAALATVVVTRISALQRRTGLTLAQ